ncbi:MAG: AgmX/PglI C-terminal domain-containing protein [Proteobacteria bacterium]|nr:AgmX/PglI C-terminal domain-containing protein [Pseudomonadota bacterium]
MKRKITKVLFLLISIFVIFVTMAYAEKGAEADKTLSPYFFIKSDDPETDRLPLKSTTARVNIAGVIADVVVTQVYKNEGRKPLEAIYIFPASTKAAVYGMKMTIGERVIIADIRKREEARKAYEQAKQDGKSASLLEQQRPNVFQMNVANILPGDVITVELKYNELLVPDSGLYEFTYPTVAGPRYSNKSAAGAPAFEKWISNPFLRQGELPTYSFDISMQLAAGLPIKEITCISHKVDIDYDGPNQAAVRLDPAEKSGGNRDFILKYRLSGGKIESGLLLFEGADENFFLLMLQPQKKVSENQIPPREYIFIVDISGSMHGFPLDISKKLLKDLIGKLRPYDLFNILLFSGGSSLMAEQSLPATTDNIQKAIYLIEHQQGGGGTELLPALKRALSLPKSEGFSRNVIIATDGYVSVEKEAFDLIRNSLGKANIFSFGIGSSVNRFLIEGMARAGMGEPFIVTKPEEAQKEAEKLRILIQQPVLTGINMEHEQFDIYDVEPSGIPDVLAQRPVIVFGKWRGKARGKIILTGFAGNEKFRHVIDVSGVKPLDTNGALRYLWARHRIANLSDYNKLSPDDKRIGEVTDLGLKYNLLTEYTSFIAVDSEVRLKNGQATTVTQPLPLPQGVSDLAVGGKGMMQSGKQQMRMNLPALSSPAQESIVSKEDKNEKDKESAIIRLEKVVASGGLSKEIVQRLIEGQMIPIQNCFHKEMRNLLKNQGKIVVKIDVDSKGTIVKIFIVRDDSKNNSVVTCITRELLKLQMPPSAGGKNGTITVTFALR